MLTLLDQPKIRTHVLCSMYLSCISFCLFSPMFCPFRSAVQKGQISQLPVAVCTCIVKCACLKCVVCLQLSFPGTLYITAQHTCFSSCTPDGQDITVKLPHSQVGGATKIKSKKRGRFHAGCLSSCYCLPLARISIKLWLRCGPRF